MTRLSRTVTIVNQKGLHARLAQTHHILTGLDAAFGHQDALRWHVLQQIQGGLQRHLKGPQIAVVHPQQWRL